MNSVKVKKEDKEAFDEFMKTFKVAGDKSGELSIESFEKVKKE